MILLMLACGGAAEEEDCVVTWNGWADGFFANYCQSCHAAESVDRRGAPEGVVFDAEADVLGWGERVWVRVLDEETMPVGGGVYAEDLVLLEAYLDCAVTE